NVQGWTDTFVKLDPDTLDGSNPASPLCSSTQNFCQAYTDSTGTTHFFKDPGSGTCEYKQVDTSHGYDWYITGTTQICNLVQNPSFEQVNDAGNNLLSNGDFETADSNGTLAAWTVAGSGVSTWAQTSSEF